MRASARSRTLHRYHEIGTTPILAPVRVVSPVPVDLNTPVPAPINQCKGQAPRPHAEAHQSIILVLSLFCGYRFRCVPSLFVTKSIAAIATTGPAARVRNATLKE